MAGSFEAAANGCYLQRYWTKKKSNKPEKRWGGVWGGSVGGEGGGGASSWVQGWVARQRPRPTLRHGCTCWVPTGDHGIYNFKLLLSQKTEGVTQSGTSMISASGLKLHETGGLSATLVALNRLRRRATRPRWGWLSPLKPTGCLHLMLKELPHFLPFRRLTVTETTKTVWKKALTPISYR